VVSWKTSLKELLSLVCSSLPFLYNVGYQSTSLSTFQVNNCQKVLTSSSQKVLLQVENWRESSAKHLAVWVWIAFNHKRFKVSWTHWSQDWWDFSLLSFACGCLRKKYLQSQSSLHSLQLVSQLVTSVSCNLGENIQTKKNQVYHLILLALCQIVLMKNLMKKESNKNWTTCLRLNTEDGSPRVFLLNSHFLGSVPKPDSSFLFILFPFSHLLL